VLPDADPENVESVELLLDGFALALELVLDGELLVEPYAELLLGVVADVLLLESIEADEVWLVATGAVMAAVDVVVVSVAAVLDDLVL
jgi:hypothetical protein